jgi:hypothetical protein
MEEFTSGRAGSRVPHPDRKTDAGCGSQAGEELRQPKGQGRQQAEAQGSQPARRRDARGDEVGATPPNPAFSCQIPDAVGAFVAHRRQHRAAGANEVLVFAAAAPQTRLDLGMPITGTSSVNGLNLGYGVHVSHLLCH